MRKTPCIAAFAFLFGLAFAQSQGAGSPPKEQVSDSQTKTLIAERGSSDFKVFETKALGLAELAKSQEKAPATTKQVSQDDIKKLISELADNDFRVREAAMQKLAEVGPAALQALLDAEKVGNAETQKRASLLIDKLRVIKVNGLEFKLVVDRTWIRSKAFEGRKDFQASYGMTLQVTNTTDKPCRLYLLDKFQLHLKSPAGQKVFANAKVSQQNSAVQLAKASPSFSKGQRLDFPAEVIVWYLGNDGVSISWIDFPGQRRLSNITCRTGTYQLNLSYNNNEQAAEGGDPYWIGSIETIPERILIK